jgi:F-box protein 18 (helicase)
MPIQPTAEQQLVVDSDADVLAVDACAGSGKSSVLEVYTDKRPGKRILLVCFNKAIAEAAKQRYPRNVECRTTHSLAFSAYGRQYAQKLGNPSAWDISQQLNCPVRHARNALTALTTWLSSTDQQMNDIHVEDEIQDEAARAQTVDLARALWSTMCDASSPMRMLHDGYLKLWALSKPVLRFDIILLEEAQDTNPVTLDIVLAQRRHAKLVFVGDRHQGIYGFRKAINAMEKVPATLRLPLTQSFRYPDEIAQIATALLQTFKQERNTIRGLTSVKARWKIDRTKHYAIISRTNVLLFGELARVVTQDKPVTAIHYVGGFNGYFFDKVLDAYRLSSNERHLIRDESILRFADFNAFGTYGEEANDFEIKALARVIAEYGDRIPDIYNALKAAESPENRSKITVTTAHKSKGLEWEQTLLTDDFIELPPPKDKEFDPEDINLLYVAVTRTRRSVELPASLTSWLEDRWPGWPPTETTATGNDAGRGSDSGMDDLPPDSAFLPTDYLLSDDGFDGAPDFTLPA